MKRSRNYCFTDQKMHNVEKYREVKDRRYILIGSEVGKKTNKTHFQGFIQFEKPISFTQAKKRLPLGIHIEACKGSETQNMKYCKKDNNLILELGECKIQGQRTDIENIYKDIKNGASELEIAEKYPKQHARYWKAFGRYKQLITKVDTKKFRQLDVEFVCGETNTGKTRTAVENNNQHYLINGYDLQWFDGYEAEKCLIIDDYDNDVKITKLLKLLDGYQCRLPVKGGFTYANWTKVIITSNLTPEQLHCNAKPQHRKALFRRIKKITNGYKKNAQSVGNTKATLFKLEIEPDTDDEDGTREMIFHPLSEAERV